jgi:hypothetical protein
MIRLHSPDLAEDQHVLADGLGDRDPAVGDGC